MAKGKKTGGRQRGTINKSTTERRLQAERELPANSGTALTPIREAELELAAAKAKGKVYTLRRVDIGRGAKLA